MAQFMLADLYLDTFPYNSGTVASDALRMSLPLVTLKGEAFASRMAGRLLMAMNAELGIAETIKGYVETAVLIASHPGPHGYYKSLITHEKCAQTLGEVRSFTTTLEQTYRTMLRKLVATEPRPS